jgi:hypothetical protein
MGKTLFKVFIAFARVIPHPHLLTLGVFTLPPPLFFYQDITRVRVHSVSTLWLPPLIVCGQLASPSQQPQLP